MVMEVVQQPQQQQQQQISTPSPRSVGCEFVRQYYTALNENPCKMHQFYNSNSMFMHGSGGIVVGQRDIHRRIMQLKFNDCRTLISQVDAQYTLGNGIVVQVTGELSNDRQPMRRFTQTFVLGAHTPKHYYVHNDIFRYQDAYADEKHDAAESDQQHNHHLSEEQKEHLLSVDQQTQVGGVSSSNGLLCAADSTSSAVAAAQILNNNSVSPLKPYLAPSIGGTHDGSNVQQLYYPAVAVAGVAVDAQPSLPNSLPNITTTNQTVLSSQVNGSAAVHEELAHAKSYTVVDAVEEAVDAADEVAVAPNSDDGSYADGLVDFQHGTNINQADMKSDEVSTKLVSEASSSYPSSVYAKVAAPVVEDFKTINEQQQQEKYEAARQQQQTNEPKTYANLFKSSNASSFVNATYQQQQQLQQQQTQNNNISAPQQSGSSLPNNGSTYAAQSASSATTFGVSRTNNSGGYNYNITSRGSKDFDSHLRQQERQFFQSNDGPSHQLFLGNIPQTATEAELDALFSKFGNVIEVRILSKPLSRNVSGVLTRSPLNFGFLTFETEESAQECLSNGPHYFNNGTTNQLLNVEEKKFRRSEIRTNFGARGNPNGGGLVRNNSNNNNGGGPRIGYNRNNDSRSHSNNGTRGNNNNTNNQGGGGGYGRR